MPREDREPQNLSAGEASRVLGVAVETLRVWERKGLLHPQRTIGGHRRYSREELDALLTAKAEA